MNGLEKIVSGWSLRTLVAALCLSGILALYGATPAWTQDAPPPPPAGDGPPPGGEEQPASDAGGGGGGKRPYLDPFKALIEPKVEAPPPTITIPTLGNTPPPPPPVLPPVQFKVNAVAGEHPAYVAVIEYEGQTYIVQAGTKVPDENPAFEVKSVTAEKVEVYDKKTQRIVQKQLISDNP
jgi:hypothetical protein